MKRGDLVLVKIFPNQEASRVVWEEHETYLICCRPEVYAKALKLKREPESSMGFPKEDVRMDNEALDLNHLVEAARVALLTLDANNLNQAADLLRHALLPYPGQRPGPVFVQGACTCTDLHACWHGPCEVRRVLRTGGFVLENAAGQVTVAQPNSICYQRTGN